MKCKHIVGFDDGYGNATEPEEYESPALVYVGDVTIPTIKCRICPLCAYMIVWVGDSISVIATRI